MSLLLRNAKGAGALVALGMILSAYLGGIFGSGGGEGVIPANSPSNEQVEEEPKAADKETSGVPAVLTVQIKGSEYFVNDEQLAGEAIAKMASERTDETGEKAPATVKILRAPDATRGAREDLEKILRSQDLLYTVED